MDIDKLWISSCPTNLRVMVNVRVWVRVRAKIIGMHGLYWRSIVVQVIHELSKSAL